MLSKAAAAASKDQTHSVGARVGTVSESSKTESLWFDSTTRDVAGRLVATQRMILRFMKEASSLYR
jgi:hypothetical protein